MVIYVGKEEDILHKDYSYIHQILLVGEGDFSFSLCLANSFGSAENIVATCLDSYAALVRKYKEAKENVRKLKTLGATVVYEVDATRMLDHEIGLMKFDLIVFNFPHAGFNGQESDLDLISKHRNLVSGFLDNAKYMLRPDGQIHVTHKTTPPFSSWNLEQLASSNSLISLPPVDFKIEDFPGYSNKRGDGSRPDERFPLGSCRTFMFVLPRYHKPCDLYPGKVSYGPEDILPIVPKNAGLVIKMVVSRCVVHRVCVSTGISRSVLSLSALHGLKLEEKDLTPVSTPLVGSVGPPVHTLGMIKLLTTLGEGTWSCTLPVTYVVLRIPAYNIILGRRALFDLKAVISPAHNSMKFPIMGGVVEVKGDIEAALRCYDAMIESGGVLMF